MLKDHNSLRDQHDAAASHNAEVGTDRDAAAAWMHSKS